MRKFVWGVLITAGIFAAIWAFIFCTGGEAMAMAIAVVASWIGFGYALAHFTGIRRHAVAHLGRRWEKFHIVSQVIKHDHRVDIQRVLDASRGQQGRMPDVFGVSVNSNIINTIANNRLPVPIEWESLARSATEVHPCANNALYLLKHKGEAYCALVQSKADRPQHGSKTTLEILARPEIAREIMRELLERAHLTSIYRGKVLTVKKGGRIAFHELPRVDRDDIVLPQSVMEVVERNVLGMLRHGRTLRRAGRSTRHGVLFHGAPGTGKTLATKYLAQACTDYTILLVTGRHLNLIRETCQLARLFSPSMVILEDVDLIARDRRKNSRASVLHELLDEMDGMGPKFECIFLLTTNRPDILEPALAARPGRIDQAIYFPLPDEDCRRLLFAKLTTGLDVGGVDLESLIHRTDGASPAFVVELFRKAALIAAERNEREARGLGTNASFDAMALRVENVDFDQAIHELIDFGGALTRRLLAFGK